MQFLNGHWKNYVEEYSWAHSELWNYEAQFLTEFILEARGEQTPQLTTTYPMKELLNFTGATASLMSLVGLFCKVKFLL